MIKNIIFLITFFLLLIGKYANGQAERFQIELDSTYAVGYQAAENDDGTVSIFKDYHTISGEYGVISRTMTKQEAIDWKRAELEKYNREIEYIQEDIQMQIQIIQDDRERLNRTKSLLKSKIKQKRQIAELLR